MANRPVRVNERPALTGHQYKAPSKVSVMERARWVEAVGGNGTRLFFEHGGFELDQESEREAFNRMGPGWRDQMLPSWHIPPPSSPVELQPHRRWPRHSVG